MSLTMTSPCHSTENILDPLRMIQNFLKEGGILFPCASPFLEIKVLGHTWLKNLLSKYNNCCLTDCRGLCKLELTIAWGNPWKLSLPWNVCIQNRVLFWLLIQKEDTFFLLHVFLIFRLTQRVNMNGWLFSVVLGKVAAVFIGKKGHRHPSTDKENSDEHLGTGERNFSKEKHWTWGSECISLIGHGWEFRFCWWLCQRNGF